MSPAGLGALAATALDLDVAADPASLVVVRHVTGGLATALGLDAPGVADLRLAVTEVCAAFIRARPPHRSRQGLQVIAGLLPGALCVVVVDPAAPPPGPGTGPPLPLLAALAETVELRNVPGGGMEVRMAFALE